MCHLNAPKRLKQRIFYSQLEYVLYCRLPENCTPDNPEPTTLLLMLITTCDMHGCDATREEVCFKELSSYSKIVDLRTICTVSVGEQFLPNTNIHHRGVLCPFEGIWAHGLANKGLLSSWFFFGLP